ncbi:MAG: SUMF1/EgtB/PvdO family nonheme iron enzyme [Anaerolineae bacterium]|nr:SUMF1/EgtB/PvdO family nonheme iron enzyme [Anaerolineae bacterium]
MNAVAASDIFIYVLSNEAVQSKYCQAEFEEARRLQKCIITIQARDRTKLTGALGDIHYVDMQHGVDDGAAVARLGGALERQAGLAKRRRPKWQPRTPKPSDEELVSRPADAPDVDTPTLQLSVVEQTLMHAPRDVRAEAREPRPRSYWVIGATVLVVAVVAVILVLSEVFGGGDNGDGDQAQPTTETQLAAASTATGEPAATSPVLPTNTPAPTLTHTPTLTNTPTHTFTPTPTATHTPVPTNTSLPTATPGPLDLAQNFSGDNDDWEPVVQEFDGVAMVLVPAGCFEMGSTAAQQAAAFEQCEADMGGDECQQSWYEDEGPAHRVCFEEPFWIDRYEVTNGQFAAFDGVAASASYFSGDDRPREQITWTEASAFCESRDARLPTEAEWEYAARGPESWMYPWGDEWDQRLVIGYRGGDEGTAPVGTIPEGVSWVGALDMSGNVWEWVTDWYGEDYYGTLLDGVVSPQGPETGDYRGLRGGSWFNSYTVGFRAAFRNLGYPLYWSLFLGFRCARSR